MQIIYLNNYITKFLHKNLYRQKIVIPKADITPPEGAVRKKWEARGWQWYL